MSLPATALAVILLAGTSNSTDQLLRQDARLSRIAARMLTANDFLCRVHMPIAGIELQSSDQYPDPHAVGLFAEAPVAVAVVNENSAAAAAGIAPGDGLLAVSGQPIDTLHPAADAPLRDAAFDLIASAPPGPLVLTLARNGERREVRLDSPKGCRVLVEIRVDGDAGARSNGKVVQVTSALAAQVDDEDLAVILAHELAHSVLEHRRRLDALGVSKGFFGEFGRNQQLNRQMEVEADRLSVHLLSNAGWNAALAPRFWRSSLGQRLNGGMLHSAVYPSAAGRAELLEREIADYLPGDAPSWPGHLLARRDATAN